mmetsp:Transcript_18016/g.27196  ORF Transcript_18016/g.27196 Transcript_18016/m.27196 type:complete len:207 (-) Transcript_18016:97-717(-)
MCFGGARRVGRGLRPAAIDNPGSRERPRLSLASRNCPQVFSKKEASPSGPRRRVLKISRSSEPLRVQSELATPAIRCAMSLFCHGFDHHRSQSAQLPLHKRAMCHVQLLVYFFGGSQSAIDSFFVGPCLGECRVASRSESICEACFHRGPRPSSATTHRPLIGVFLGCKPTSCRGLQQFFMVFHSLCPIHKELYSLCLDIRTSNGG